MGQSSALVPKGHHFPPAPSSMSKVWRRKCLFLCNHRRKEESWQGFNRLWRTVRVFFIPEVYRLGDEILWQSIDHSMVVVFWNWCQDKSINRQEHQYHRILDSSEVIISLLVQLQIFSLANSWPSEILRDMVLTQVGGSCAVCLLNTSIKSMGCITSLPNISMLTEKNSWLVFQWLYS